MASSLCFAASSATFLATPSCIRPGVTSRRAPVPARARRRTAHVRCDAEHPSWHDPLSLDADLPRPFAAVPNRGTNEDVDASTEFAGGSGSSGAKNRSGGSGGSGDNEDLPADITEALKAGLIGSEAIARYRNFAALPLLGWLMSVPAFRTRMLADSTFIFKLLIQELVGNGTALASEITERGPAIFDELEYVASDLIVGTVVEAAFVWLLAPTLALPSKNGSNALSRYLSALPSNAFVASTKARSFTTTQRAAAFVYAGAQYAVIGFAAGIVGTAITYGLISARQWIDPSYSPKRALPDVIPNSAAWGAFMSLSSNTRFQIVEGMERGIAVLTKGSKAPLVNYGIVALRTANNYWGGVQFVQFFRFLGLHEME